MARRYLLAEDTIDASDRQDLIDWLSTDPWLTQGALVQEFEAHWAQWLGVKHAIFVNSGSSANLLMYYSLLVSQQLQNKKVIVPAVSWSTTVAPAIQLGFEPIMCEADWHNFGLDMDHMESLLKEHSPAAVILVHVLGVPNDMDRLMELQARYGFTLMEDTCAAMGSRHDGQMVGTFGELSSFSFYFGHHMSTIEGGMVCTNDEALNDILLQIRSHGWAKNLAPEKEEEQAKRAGAMEFNRPFTFYYPGFNVRSTDLNARIGLSQMNRIDQVVERRIENHRIYQARFMDVPDFHCQRNDRSEICSISFTALAESPEHREKVAKVLTANDIETRPLGGGNMSRQPFWSDNYGTTVFPVADRIHETGFQLPNHPLLSSVDINHICDTVLSVSAEE